MQPRPIQNPPNPFASTDRVYLEGMDPGTTVHVYEDSAQEILAKNDSPDLGFSNAARSSSGACRFTMIRVSKSVPAPNERYSCVGRA